MTNATPTRIEAVYNASIDHFGQRRHAWAFIATLEHIENAPSMGQLSVAEYGIGGYTPLYCYFDTFKEAQHCADELNARRGLSLDEVARIVCDSMKRPAGMAHS